jgi:hypothetical protein
VLEEGEQTGKVTLERATTPMIGSSREWVAQKYQLFQCFSAQPRRW